MAKFVLKIPHVHPSVLTQEGPPSKELAIYWSIVFRTNSPDQFVNEIAEYLLQCLPVKIVLSDDLTPGEREYYNNIMDKKQTEVNKKLLVRGLPLTQKAEYHRVSKEEAR